MKNERYLIKENLTKMIKMLCILGSIFFLTGFYDPGSNYITLEDITIELGEKIPEEKFNYINNYLINSNLVLEDNVPKDNSGHTIKAGQFNYYIVYRDEERKYSKLTKNSAAISVIDTVKPEIRLKNTTLSFKYGSVIDINNLASCYDLSSCNISFKSKINTKKEGNQEVIIVAVDSSNNVSEMNINIHIKKKPVYYAPRYDSMENNNKNISNNLSDKDIVRNKVVAYAKQFEGNPYVYGGNSLTNGIDCSGFTKAIYGHFGYQLPRSSKAQAYIGISVKRSELLPGDMIVFHKNGVAYHVGIYMGNNKIIHASTPKTGIKISTLWNDPQFYRRIIY